MNTLLSNRFASLAFGLLLLGGCKDKKEESKPITLTGKWVGTTMDHTSYNSQNQVTFQANTLAPANYLLSFNTDGTFETSVAGTRQVNGTYVRTNDHVVMTHTERGVGLVNDDHTILELTQDKLSLRHEVPDQQGGRTVYMQGFKRP
jgi:hypothetical protein